MELGSARLPSPSSKLRIIISWKLWRIEGTRPASLRCRGWLYCGHFLLALEADQAVDDGGHGGLGGGERRSDLVEAVDAADAVGASGGEDVLEDVLGSVEDVVLIVDAVDHLCFVVGQLGSQAATWMTGFGTGLVVTGVCFFFPF